ncbi:Oidioi.mRNA.OKI2018_I69.chr2.g5272.t1.cds [Oikopleura dioica]|uniref:Oidioi.mRNA.OKI2018_I69.chr2.g5272.t1.cds n=1 Tax=Oikopleura dioica TaxID=34765 RepID=A0ABN7T5R7_OIKDI|nr:Oidioi.mRNA.OKI2018_I69.chr2.g5272.t1.cds [Oikopleura dioica]
MVYSWGPSMTTKKPSNPGEAYPWQLECAQKQQLLESMYAYHDRGEDTSAEVHCEELDKDWIEYEAYKTHEKCNIVSPCDKEKYQKIWDPRCKKFNDDLDRAWAKANEEGRKEGMEINLNF